MNHKFLLKPQQPKGALKNFWKTFWKVFVLRENLEPFYGFQQNLVELWNSKILYRKFWKGGENRVLHFVRSALLRLWSSLLCVLRIWCLSFSGVISSAPYSSLEGVDFVALDAEVLGDQITFGSSSAHFPFFWSKRYFLMLVKIIPLALSTASLDWGW